MSESRDAEPLTPEMRRQIINLLSWDVSVEEIARDVGCSQSTVIQIRDEDEKREEGH